MARLMRYMTNATVALTLSAVLVACGVEPEDQDVADTGSAAVTETTNTQDTNTTPVDAPEVDSVETIALQGEGLFPEGVLTAPNGDLFVTGFGNGSILRVVAAEGDRVEVFKASGEDGLSSAVGMNLDEARGRLWVSNFSFDTFTSNLKVFDATTGDLIATVEPTGDGIPEAQFFNEVAIDDDGRVYVSDTLTPTVWTASPELDGVTVFASDPLLANLDEKPFGLNGLTLTPGGDYLVASVMDRITQGDGRLVRIEVATGEVTDIALSGDTAIFGGGDGILFHGDELLMVNVTPPASIVSASFSSDFSSATLTARSAFDEHFDRPTAPAIRGDRLWVVSSQLDHIIDDMNGALDTPPELPFQLVGVLLSELMN